MWYYFSMGNNTRNDGRKNGKAAKQTPGRKVKGSSKTKLSDGQKLMLNGGMYVHWAQLDKREKLSMKRRTNKDKSNGE